MFSKIVSSFGLWFDSAAAGQVSPLGSRKARRRAEAGNARDQDKIDALEDGVFDCESELRLVEEAIGEYQSLAQLRQTDAAHKQKYIKQQVHDPAWRARFR